MLHSAFKQYIVSTVTQHLLRMTIDVSSLYLHSPIVAIIKLDLTQYSFPDTSDIIGASHIGIQDISQILHFLVFDQSTISHPFRGKKYRSHFFSFHPTLHYIRIHFASSNCIHSFSPRKCTYNTIFGILTDPFVFTSIVLHMTGRIPSIHIRFHKSLISYSIGYCLVKQTHYIHPRDDTTRSILVAIILSDFSHNSSFSPLYYMFHVSVTVMTVHAHII